MLARAPLRPGEEERKTEIETAGGRGRSGQTGWEASRTKAPGGSLTQ